MRTILCENDAEDIYAFIKKPAPNYLRMGLEVEGPGPIVVKQRRENGQEDCFPRQPRAVETVASLPNFDKSNYPLAMRLCLPTQKGFVVIRMEDIIYCEAKRNYTQFHLLGSKPITVSSPLFDYDRILTDTTFLRIHKSFLINLLHVKEYIRGEGGTVIMDNGMEIEVSRRKRNQFLAKIKESFRY